MRILFVSNLYPPHARGGYEQWCQEVALLLEQRGHLVTIMTSRVDDTPTVEEEQGVMIHRFLVPELEGGLLSTVQRLLTNRKGLEAQNLTHITKLLSQIEPDVILLWGMWNLPQSIPAFLESVAGGRLAYFLCDYWLMLPNAYIQRWQEPARHAIISWPKRFLGKLFLHRLKREQVPQLTLRYVIGVSQRLLEIHREAGIHFQKAQVIHGGTETEQFARYGQARKQTHEMRLLYVGRLEKEKGVHTAIKALAEHQLNGIPITLDIYGAGSASYEETLKGLVTKLKLEDRVNFCGRVDRRDIPAIMAKYDLLIFPSEWDEPFARTVLEAMSSGLLVVGTTTGGTGEILINGQTGLTYQAGQPDNLACQLLYAWNKPAQRAALALNGQKRVNEKHHIDRMIADFEYHLSQVNANATRTNSNLT